MTPKDELFERVNELLENADYPAEVKDISDLEDFLNEVENQQYEEYEEIEKLYNDPMEDPDFLDD